MTVSTTPSARPGAAEPVRLHIQDNLLAREREESYPITLVREGLGEVKVVDVAEVGAAPLAAVRKRSNRRGKSMP